MAAMLRGLAVGLIAAGVLGGALVRAQDVVRADGPLPQFEVATVKLMHPEAIVALNEGAATGSAGAAAALTTTGGETIRRQVEVRVSYDEGPFTDQVHLRWKAKVLIEIAYGLRIGSDIRVVGGPDWIDNDGDRYEILGKIDDASFASMKAMPTAERNTQISLMKQALLADRFKLKVHIETRQLPVYALVQAKGGTKMTVAKPDEKAMLTGVGNGTNNTLTGQAMTMADLVHSPLLKPEGRMVVDQTGLTGRYDFTVKSATGADTDGPSLFTAMEEQLGLKLVSTKAAVEVIVVDHVERPDAN